MTDVNVTVTETDEENSADSMVLSNMSLLPNIGGASVLRVLLLFLGLLIILLPGVMDFGLFPWLFTLDVGLFVGYVFLANWTPARMGMLTHARRRAQLAWGQRVYLPVQPSAYSFERPGEDYRRYGDDTDGSETANVETETESESETHVDRPLHV